MDDAEVRLSLSALRALMRPQRLRALRHLRLRPMTAAELGKSLKLSKSSAHFHLMALSTAGFVRRTDSGRLWVYYELTPSGEAIASKDHARILLVLHAMLATATALLLAAIVRVPRPSPTHEVPWSVDDIGAPAPTYALDPAGVLLLVGLVVAVAVVGFTILRKHLRRIPPRQDTTILD